MQTDELNVTKNQSLSLALFIEYINYISQIHSKQFPYADDLPIFRNKSLKDSEEKT